MGYANKQKAAGRTTLNYKRNRWIQRILTVAFVLAFGVLVLAACAEGYGPPAGPQTTPIASGSTPARLTPISDVEARVRTSVASDLSVTPTSEQLAQDEIDVTVHDLAYNPDSYLTDSVIVRGEVSEVMSNGVFWLSDPTDLTGEVLVLTPVQSTDVAQALSEGANIVVSGDMRSMSTINLEELNIDTGILPDLNGVEAVLIAQRIAAATEGGS
jgi:hypothetical protein